MEAGVYKDTNGNYGFLAPNGNFVPNLPRSKARELAKENGLFTTFRGTYVPPEPTKERKRRRFHWLSFPVGCTIRTCKESEFIGIREAARIYKKKNPDFDFSVTESDGIYTFTRAEPGTGKVVRKNTAYPWKNYSAYWIGATMYITTFDDRLKVYNAAYQYHLKNPKFMFRMISDKENNTATFVRASEMNKREG